MLLLQTLCFHKYLFTSTALHQWETSVCMPCQYHALSCSHSQVVIMWITLSVSNFTLQILYSELLISRNLRMLHWGCRVIQSNHILWWLPKSTNMCVARQCLDEARFLLDSSDAEFMWNNSWVLSVSWCMHWSWLSPTEASHSQESHLHSARREWSWPHLVTETFSIFLPWENGDGAIPWIVCLTPVQMMDPRFICCNKPGSKHANDSK